MENTTKPKTRLQVTFSKRRKGLFKKVEQLNTLYGVTVGGKFFATPSAEHVISLYNKGVHGGDDVQESCCNNGGDHACSRKCEKEFKNDLGWWKKDIDEMGLEELEEFKNGLVELKQNLMNMIT